MINSIGHQLGPIEAGIKSLTNGLGTKCFRLRQGITFIVHIYIYIVRRSFSTLRQRKAAIQTHDTTTPTKESQKQHGYNGITQFSLDVHVYHLALCLGLRNRNEQNPVLQFCFDFILLAVIREAEEAECKRHHSSFQTTIRLQLSLPCVLL